MEKNYNTDNFEQLLRETTDEFRMYPSKRVWHSLYNDLHPGRKWPSLAILLLLVSSIMYVGITNSNETIAGKDNGQKPVVKNAPLLAANTFNAPDVEAIHDINETPAVKTTFINNPDDKAHTEVADQNAISLTANDLPLSGKGKRSLFQRNNSATATIGNSIAESDILNTGSDNSGFVSAKNNQAPVKETVNLLLIEDPGPSEPVQIALNAVETGNTNNPGIVPAAMKSINIPSLVFAETENIDDKAWMEDYAMYNKKPAHKWKNRISYEVYITPSVGYRSLKNNTEYSVEPANTLIANPAQINNVEYGMNHFSAINLEAGTNMILSFSKRLRLKAGVQLNYTNYRISAYQLNHPTFAILMLNDLTSGYPVWTSRPTTLANTPGLSSKNLNNNTYQLSIPLGADFRIAGNNNIKWYAGAAIQPTYVAGGHAYLISSDLKNYVSGNDLMRTFNVNGDIETFISYKTKNGIIVSAGPQLRYQFLSTYSKAYTYDEKLYNLGIKLGMTTNF